MDRITSHCRGVWATGAVAMETRTTVMTAAGIIIGVQVGLFAWLKADIGALTDRVAA